MEFDGRLRSQKPVAGRTHRWLGFELYLVQAYQVAWQCCLEKKVQSQRPMSLGPLADRFESSMLHLMSVHHSEGSS